MAKDIVSELGKDHREVEKLLARYEGAHGRVGTARGRASIEKTFAELRRELSVHAEAEEMVLYPELRTAMPSRGEKLADEGLEEHQRVKETLAALGGLDVAEAEFEQRMDDLAADVRHHVAEEEREIFAELPKHLPPERLRELGDAVRRAKEVAPTRPHPSAPNRPPANLVMGVISGAIDRIRDSLTSGTVVVVPSAKSGSVGHRRSTGARTSVGRSARAKTAARKSGAGASSKSRGRASTASARKGPKSKSSRAKTSARAKTASRAKTTGRAKVRPRSKPRSTGRARVTATKAGAKKK